MRSRELQALTTKFHGSIPDNKDRSWEISTETFLRFPWSTQEATMWKQVHFSSHCFRNKNIQKRPKTWYVSFHFPARRPSQTLKLYVQLLSVHQRWRAYPLQNTHYRFCGKKIIMNNYHSKSQSLTKIFLWVKLIVWAEWWSIHLLGEIRM